MSLYFPTDGDYTTRTIFPGVVIHSQGLLQRELGREEEARAQFRRALLLPDQQLSHFLSRRALEGAPPFP